jgi:hypothetical protein
MGTFGAQRYLYNGLKDSLVSFCVYIVFGDLTGGKALQYCHHYKAHIYVHVYNWRLGI